MSYNEILQLCQADKNIAHEYFKKLFETHFPNYKKINIDKPLTSIMRFHPLPFEFITDNLPPEHPVINKDNCYFFNGKIGNRMLLGNRKLPVFDQDPIPFIFPITKNNKTNIILSNTFYFEAKIINAQFRKAWNNECLSLGYGSINTNCNNHVGWTTKSWGFHSDDGTYINSNMTTNYTEKWKLNDTIGVGLSYISKNKYGLFLTKNGLLINKIIIINCDEILVPMMGIDISYPIEINWGNNEFKFNLENYIFSSEILSLKNSFLNNEASLSNYTVIPSYNINKSEIFGNKFGIIGDKIIKKITYTINFKDKEQNDQTLEQISQQMTEQINQLISEETKYETNEETNEGTIEQTNEGTNEQTNVGTNEETNVGTNEGTNEETNVETNVGTNVGTNEETNEQMINQMNQMNQNMNQINNEINQQIIQQIIQQMNQPNIYNNNLLNSMNIINNPQMNDPYIFAYNYNNILSQVNNLNLYNQLILPQNYFTYPSFYLPTGAQYYVPTNENFSVNQNTNENTNENTDDNTDENTDPNIGFDTVD